MLITLNCENCKIEFERDSRRKRKTCSEECRKKIYRKSRNYDKGYKLTPDLIQKIKNGKRKAQIVQSIDYNNAEPRKKGSPAKIVLNELGELTHKECTTCCNILPADYFKFAHGKSKLSKTNLRSACRVCEYKTRTTKRRHGIPARFLPAFNLDANGGLAEKECTKCFKMRDASDYQQALGGRWNKKAACKFCEASRSTVLHYGIDALAKLEIYKAQDERCDICKVQKTINALYIDHDHCAPKGTGFRGLICRNCNFAYGLLGDGNDKTPEILRGMLDYYNKTKSI